MRYCSIHKREYFADCPECKIRTRAAMDSEWDTQRDGQGPEQIWLVPGQAQDPAECTLSHVNTDGHAGIPYIRKSLVINGIVGRIVLIRTEKKRAERAGHDRDVLRLDGAIATLESLLEDTANYEQQRENHNAT